MQKWEYKIIERSCLKQVAGVSTAVVGEWDREITLSDLTSLGNEGWELTGIAQRSEPSTTPGAITQERWIFKKPQPIAAGAAVG